MMNPSSSRRDSSRRPPRDALSRLKIRDVSELQAMMDSDLESQASRRKTKSRGGSAAGKSHEDPHKRRSSNSSSGDELPRSSSHERRKRRHHERRQRLYDQAVKKRKLLILPLLAISLVVIGMVGDLQSMYEFGRRLCGLTLVYEKGSYVGYWERGEDLLPEYNYITNPRALISAAVVTSVGYVVTLRSCPEDLVEGHHDPGHAFYDAAAIMEYILCEVHQDASNSTYNDCTFYAIVHPDAMTCMGPDGTPYDRVKVLEDLGYWVKIWGSEMAPYEIQDTFLRNTIEDDVGLNDLSMLNAFRLTQHDIVVFVDFSTLMFQRPDELFDEFAANTTLEAMYVLDWAETMPATGANMGANMGFFMIKPSNETFDQLNEEFKNATYDSDAGWNNSGVTGFTGSKGTRGLLTQHYTKGNGKDKGKELDRCLYGNDNGKPRADQAWDNMCKNGKQTCEDCRTKNITEIFVANPRTVCGEPWDCWYDENWDSDTKPLCEDFHRTWYEHRLSFEQKYMTTQTNRSGTYHPEVFLGYCHEQGWAGYDLMLPDNGECLGPTQSSFGNATVPGVDTVQTIELVTGQVTGNGKTCVSGYVSTPWYSPPFNIGIVVDVSGSAQSNFDGTANAGDVNQDGTADTILDAELSAVIQLIEALLAVPGLDDDSLDIGLISFERWATYHGRFVASDAVNGNASAINADLLSALVAMRASGWTNFDDALDKAVDYFNVAPSGRTNVLYFLSDGIPNTCGDGDNETCVEGNWDTGEHSVHFDSELAILDSMRVVRHAIGVGQGSDVSDGNGLDKIDNTLVNGTKAQQVTTTSGLVELLNANPIEGTIVSLEVTVNGVTLSTVDASLLVSGPTGYGFGEVVVNGLNQAYGFENEFNATIVIDQDGNFSTTEDQFTMTATSTVVGSVTNWLGFNRTVTPSR